MGEDRSARADDGLRAIVGEVLTVGDVVSAAIFVIGSDGATLELAAAGGIQGQALDGLANAVRDPSHPVARALTDEEASFDVRPLNPGGPALRSHLPLRAGPGNHAAGVLAVAHDRPLGPRERRRLDALAARAAGLLQP